MVRCLVRMPLTVALLVMLAAASSVPSPADSDAVLKPPCSGDAFPASPDADHSPEVKAWGKTPSSANWVPPGCTGWQDTGYSTLVSTIGRFRYTGDAESLLHRFGAISELKGLRYWSTTHKQWQTLIVNAYALQDSSGNSGRKDFTPDELKAGKPLFYQQEDSLTGKGIYKMRVISAAPDRLVIDTQNVSTLRYYLVPVFHPGDVQSIYFLERESPEIWRYYNITRTGKNSNRLSAGHEASSINRAVAFYRHTAGMQTDKDPPYSR